MRTGAELLGGLLHGKHFSDVGALVLKIHGVVPRDDKNLDAKGGKLFLRLLPGAVGGQDDHLGGQGGDLFIVQLPLAFADDLLRVEHPPVIPVLGGVQVHGNHLINGPAGPDQFVGVPQGYSASFHRIGECHLPAHVIG